jgi:ribosomal protein L11 methyltransferase
MDTYVFSVQTKERTKEYILGVLYSYGMIACEEKDTDDRIIIICYFDTYEKARTAQHIAARTHAPTKIARQIPQDWNKKWRDSIEPVWLNDTIVVSPPWKDPKIKQGQHWIQIEPKMAFGTGHHETTQLAARAILNETGSRLLDIGTGSGILLFVAQIAGYREAVGVEIDPNCRENLQENIEQNRGATRIKHIIGSHEDLTCEACFDTVVINIITEHSYPIVKTIHPYLTTEGTLIWSGILTSQKDEVVSFAEKQGFMLLSEDSRGEWWYGRFTRNS